MQDNRDVSDDNSGSPPRQRRRYETRSVRTRNLQRQKRQQKNWENAKTKFIPLGKKEGVVCYGMDREKLDDLYSSTGNNEPDNLEGTYSIFYMTDAPAFQQGTSRTVRGTLSLTKRAVTVDRDNDDNDAVGNNNDETRFVWSGRGEIKGYWDFTLGQPDPANRTDRQGPAWQLLFGIEGDFDDDFELCEMHVIRERVALPWVPTEEADEDELEQQFDNEKMVKFHTLEEAEALVQEYKDRLHYSNNSWMSKHLPFPAEVTKNIHEFATSWRPCPVLFLEPGDLLLTIHFPEPCFPSVMRVVARKQEEENV